MAGIICNVSTYPETNFKYLSNKVLNSQIESQVIILEDVLLLINTPENANVSRKIAQEPLQLKIQNLFPLQLDYFLGAMLDPGLGGGSQ